MCIMNFPGQLPLPRVLPSSVLCSLTTESLRTASWNLKTKGSPQNPTGNVNEYQLQDCLCVNVRGFWPRVGVRGEFWKLLRVEGKESQVERHPIRSLQGLVDPLWSLCMTRAESLVNRVCEIGTNAVWIFNWRHYWTLRDKAPFLMIAASLNRSYGNLFYENRFVWKVWMGTNKVFFTEYQIFCLLSWLALKRSLAQIDEVVQILSLLALQSRWSNNWSPQPLLVKVLVKIQGCAKLLLLSCNCAHDAGLLCNGDPSQALCSEVLPARSFIDQGLAALSTSSIITTPLLWECLTCP